MFQCFANILLFFRVTTKHVVNGNCERHRIVCECVNGAIHLLRNKMLSGGLFL